MEISQELIEKIDTMITEEMIRHGNPGVALGIVADGGLVLKRSYGSRSIEKRLPVDPDTLFMVASVTKSFVCACIMKLQEQEKLSVTDPIHKYIPVTVGMADHPITIHHLMSHTSGLPDISDDLWYVFAESSYQVDDEVPKIPFTSWEDIYRHINQASEVITATPGEKFYYNNLAYGLLSQIIEKITDRPWEEYLDEHILSPLSMDRSGFIEDINQDDNITEPYRIKKGSEVRELIVEGFIKRNYDKAAGGLFTSVNQLGNYVIMHLNQGTFNNQQILNPASIAEMQYTQFIEAYPNLAFTSNYGSYGQTGYGYGFVVHTDFYGTKLVHHSGSFHGASAWLAFLPEKNIGVVMLSNLHPSPRIFAQAILMELLGINSSQEFHLNRYRHHNELLCGTYTTFRKMSTATIDVRNNTLYFKDREQEFPLIPIGDPATTLEFYSLTEIGGKLPVQFEIENKEIWLHIERMKFKKVRRSAE